MGENEQVLVNLGELFDDMLDLDITDGSAINISETTENIYASDTRRELALELLKGVRDSYLQLSGLNNAVSLFLKQQSQSSVAYTQDKVRKMTSSEDSKIETISCKNQLTAKITKLNSEIETDTISRELGITTSSGSITVADLSTIAGSIPPALGKEDYTLLVAKIAAKHDNYFERLTLEEKIEVRDRLSAILYYCDGIDEIVNTELPKFSLVADVSKNKFLSAQDSADSDQGNNFKIPIFDVVERLKNLIVTMSQIKDTNVTKVPNVYSIKNIEEVKDNVYNKTYYKYTLELLFSLDVVPETDKVIYRPVDFLNQMHLVGISHVRVKKITENLVEYTHIATKKISEIMEIDDYQDNIKSNIIGVPYYITGKNNDGSDYIVVSDNPNYTVNDLAEYKAGNYTNYRAFLLEATSKRVADVRSIWFTTVTSSASSTPQFITAKVNTSIDYSTTRYSGEELYRIAKSKNIRSNILRNFPKGKAFDNLQEDVKREVEVQRDLDRRLFSSFKDKCNGIKFGFNNSLSPNRSILMQAIMQHVTKPVRSRIDVISTFESNKSSILNKTVPQIFAKFPYDREAIANVLGGLISKPNVHTYVTKQLYLKDVNFKLSLYMSEIVDYVAMVCKLRRFGYSSQDFLSGNIVKDMSTKELKEVKEVTKDEFIKEFIYIMTNPTNLMDAWGAIPECGEKITLSSSNYNFILTCLVEAYQIITLLLGSDAFSNAFVDSTDLEMLKKEEVMKVSYEYNKKLDMTGNYTGYEAVSDLGISQEFYEGYCTYLNNIINTYFLTKGALSSQFDSGILINNYIRLLAETMRKDKNLSYKLFYSHAGLPEVKDGELSDIYEDILLDAESEENYTLEKALDMLNMEDMLPQEDKKLLNRLFEHARDLVCLTTSPLVELLRTIEAVAKDGKLETFYEESEEKYILRMGFDSKADYEVNFNVSLSSGNYTPDRIKEFIEEGFNLYSVRDAIIIQNILGGTKFKNILKLMDKTPITSEDWESINLEMKNYINSKIKKYNTTLIESNLTRIASKVEMFIEPTLLVKGLKAYIDLIAPTEIDAVLLLNYINTRITDLISNDARAINLSSIKLKEVKLEDIAELESRLFEARRLNDFTLALASFLPIDTILDSNNKLQEINNEVLELIERSKIEEEYIDPKSIKKDIALFKKYLETGNDEYKKSININAIPFELLTVDDVKRYVKSGPYSQVSLIYDHALVDLNDESARMDAMRLSYKEVLDMVIEQYPEFCEDCPRAIREYILAQESLKLN